MYRRNRYWIFIGLLLLLNCTINHSAIIGQTFVPPVMKQGAYRIIAIGITGRAQKVLFLPLEQTNVHSLAILKKEALDDLWRQFRKNFGEPEGHSLALMHVVWTTSGKSFLLFSKITMEIRADVIEFQN